MKIRSLLAFLFITFLFTGCRKDIDVPNTEMQKLFGEWTWYETSGGLDGYTYTPSNQYYNLRIKFTDKGIYKSYKNNSQNSKAKFDLAEGTTIFGNVPANIITYHGKTGFLGSEEVDSKQSINFWGNDTLILIDETMDGFNHYYVRK